MEGFDRAACPHVLMNTSMGFDRSLVVEKLVGIRPRINHIKLDEYTQTKTYRQGLVSSPIIFLFISFIFAVLQLTHTPVYKYTANSTDSTVSNPIPIRRHDETKY
jgi:hypothetical protein